LKINGNICHQWVLENEGRTKVATMGGGKIINRGEDTKPQSPKVKTRPPPPLPRRSGKGGEQSVRIATDEQNIERADKHRTPPDGEE